MSCSQESSSTPCWRPRCLSSDGGGTAIPSARTARWATGLRRPRRSSHFTSFRLRLHEVKWLLQLDDWFHYWGQVFPRSANRLSSAASHWWSVSKKPMNGRAAYGCLTLKAAKPSASASLKREFRRSLPSRSCQASAFLTLCTTTRRSSVRATCSATRHWRKCPKSCGIDQSDGATTCRGWANRFRFGDCESAAEWRPLRRERLGKTSEQSQRQTHHFVHPRRRHLA